MLVRANKKPRGYRGLRRGRDESEPALVLHSIAEAESFACPADNPTRDNGEVGEEVAEVADRGFDERENVGFHVAPNIVSGGREAPGFPGACDYLVIAEMSTPRAERAEAMPVIAFCC